MLQMRLRQNSLMSQNLLSTFLAWSIRHGFHFIQINQRSSCKSRVGSGASAWNLFLFMVHSCAVFIHTMSVFSVIVVIDVSPLCRSRLPSWGWPQQSGRTWHSTRWNSVNPSPWDRIRTSELILVMSLFSAWVYFYCFWHPNCSYTFQRSSIIMLCSLFQLLNSFKSVFNVRGLMS